MQVPNSGPAGRAPTPPLSRRCAMRDGKQTVVGSGLLDSRLLLLLSMKKASFPRSSWLLAAGLFAQLSACSSMKTEISKDPQANLAQYKTYAWMQRETPTQGNASVVDQVVRSSVDKELAAKGLRPATDA